MFSKPEKVDYEVFVTYDSKSKSYDIPVFVPSKEVLMRDIINLMNDPKHQTATRVLNAEDFSLFKIGSYTLKDGKLTISNHEHVANFHDLRAMSNWKPVQYVVEPKLVESPRAL